ncbi:AAA family ATPase [Archangium sp.]|uniref:McrB family protein n=1 Tax=Archangium sp. TaxID=1872627 RepID=UPI00286C792F|nr:AAA family ATPase [Archangium sp.]
MREKIAEWLQNSEDDRRVREQAEVQARVLIEKHLGRLSEAQLRQVMKHLNTCVGANGVVFTRFVPAFMGRNANLVVSALDRLNPLIEELWRANDDQAVAPILDRFWAADIPGAGRSFPTAILYLKDPERYSVWTSNLDRTMHSIIGRSFKRPVRRSGEYLRYCEHVRRFRADHGIPAALHDNVLWFLSATKSEPRDKPKGDTAPVESGTSSIVGDESAETGPTTLRSLSAETWMEPAFFQKLDRLLADKKQLILYGPPGTGKTFVALKYAEYLAQRGGGDVTTVQFHPSYGYEDFVEGLRPSVDQGQLQYRVEPGVFRQVCDRARAKPQARFVLLVDEFNRGNLPRILGELLFLLERRGHDVVLPYSKQRFAVPENVVVLGTMNSADRSIALLDLALRRRFHFVEVQPSEEVLRAYLVQHGRQEWIADLLGALNSELEKAGIERDRLVGHSHFMVRDLDEERLELIWEATIEPLLRELFFSEPERLNAFALEPMRRLAEARAGDEEQEGEPQP